MKLINRKKAGILLIAILAITSSFAQRTINGTVKDVNGDLLPGTSVTVKGTTVGAETDFDGAYTINVPKDATTLIFSFLGYVSQEIKIGTQNTIDVTLEEDTNQLDEVVISTGYRTMPKSQATGAFATVSSKDLDKVITPNLLDKLEGQLAGVDVQDGNIVIRGQNTFNTGEVNIVPDDGTGSADPSNPEGVSLADGSQVNYRTNPSAPLIVLDGFPYEGNLNDLDPNDVESITVLKDAASSSIWGTRASNGVIVITRKRAPKNGTTEVQFNTYVKISDVPNIADYNFAPAYVAFDMERYALDSLGGANSLGIRVAPSSALEQIYYRRDILRELTWPQAERMLQKLRNQSNYGQAKNAFLRGELEQNYNFQLSHATKKFANVLTANYTNSMASSIGNEDNRINIGLRTTYKMADWIDVQFNYNAIVTKQDANSSAHLFTSGRLRPYENILDENGNYAPMLYEHNQRYGDLVNFNTSLGYLPWDWNALEEQNNNDISSELNSHNLQAQVNVKLGAGFSYIGKAQYRYGRTEKILDYNTSAFFTRNMINTFTQREEVVPGVFSLTHNFPKGGGIKQTTASKFTDTNLRNTLNFDNTFNDIHQISATVGTELNIVDTDFDTGTILGNNPISGDHGTRFVNLRDVTIDFPTQSSQYTFNGQPAALLPYQSSTGFARNRDFSVLGYLGYVLDSKYNISASGRIEKSNLTGSDKSNTLWSVGAGWNISNEEFFSNMKDVFNYAKIRGSFGYTGNVDRSALPFLRGIQGISALTGLPYIVINEPSNPTLKPERTRKINVGLDLRAFGRRLNITADYYNEFSTNLIVNQRVDPTVRGWAQAKENNGTILNEGIDLKLEGRIIQNDNFSWTSTLNLGYNKSTVEDYSTDGTGAYYRDLLSGTAKAIGFDVNPLFTFNNGGLDENGNPTIIIDGVQRSTNLEDADGNIREGVDLIGIDDLIYHGSRVPTTYGGLFNTFGYKGLSLSFNFNYSFGGHMYMPSTGLTYQTDIVPNKEILNAWQQPGDELTTNVPRLISSVRPPEEEITHQNHENWYRYASNRVEKSDVVRLRYITLGYNLPRSLTEKIRMKSLRLSAQVENVGFWASNSQNIDPGFINRPNPRVFTLGLYTTF